MKKNAPQIDKFVLDQLSVWPLASANFRSLKTSDVRTLDVGGLEVSLQHNPERLTSSTARIDPESIKARACFLCAENEPAEQMRLPFEGRKGRKYNIQVNPYPIFPQHLVIAAAKHTPQSIWHRFVDMLDLARTFGRFTFFYNGPMSGASAPDHFHFQACPQGLMPLERDIDSLLDKAAALAEEGDGPCSVPGELDYLSDVREAEAYHYRKFTRGIFALRARTAKSMAKMFYRLVDSAPLLEGESEPRFNLFTWSKGGELRTIVVFRNQHHTHHYYSTGEDHLTMSPGCADMAGFFIVPVAEDYAKLDGRLLAEMMDEASATPETETNIIWKMTRTQPKLEVGIMSAREIAFEIISDGAGLQKVSWHDGKIDYNGVLYDELLFEARTMSTLFAEPSFILHDVVIGVQFHWERKVDQTFAGALKFIVEGDMLTAVNIIGVEDYLLSVISSEMRASASLEFLKAHAVISRSWVMSHIGHRACGEHRQSEFNSVAEDGTPVYIRWWDHDDHSNFDVCADDHCQRYQGLSMAVGDTVREAIDQTWGQVLTYGGEICDARFSKCCGGMMETFDTCWEDAPHPYLQAVPDAAAPGGDPFCHTSDEAILSQVLNDFDLETKDFYEWEVRYSRPYLSELIARRSGMDWGTIQELIPLERGESGRLKTLKVVGTARTMIIGKELVIRRWLSESHLKSSAFDVAYEGDDIILRGRGWGHGVGLCQIGAAVMSVRGYTYEQILAHYYPGSSLERR